MNGRAVSGCLYLAVLVDGAEVSTVEQLAEDGGLDVVQKAFIEAGGFQHIPKFERTRETI